MQSSSQEPGNIQRWLRAALFISAVGLPLAALYKAAVPISIGRPWDRWASSAPVASDPKAVVGPVQEPVVDLDNERVRLQKVLKAAAMKDKTVILTTLNEAWATPNSVLDVFMDSFRLGEGTQVLLNHLVMIALDKKAYERCMSLHPYCYALTTGGVDFSGEKTFMSQGYLNMMWRRIDFLRTVLEMGYNFIFTDTDIVWFRNPMPHFYPDGDFQIACDTFNGKESDLHNWPNGGFNYVKSNNRTIEFYKFWYSAREKHPGRHDQDVLNFIKFDPYLSALGLKMKFLNTAYFGGLCEPSKDFNKVCTMHANCCIGLGNKIHDLKGMLEDWRKFKSLTPEVKRSQRQFWSVPQNCTLAVALHHHN